MRKWTAILLIMGILCLFAGALAEWTCPNCGQTGNTGNFCPNCAQPQPLASWTCPNCGQEGNTGRFCPNCAFPNPNGQAIWTCPVCGLGNAGRYCTGCAWDSRAGYGGDAAEAVLTGRYELQHPGLNSTTPGDTVTIHEVNGDSIRFSVIWSGIYRMAEITGKGTNGVYPFVYASGGDTVQGFLSARGRRLHLSLTSVSGNNGLLEILMNEGYMSGDYTYVGGNSVSGGTSVVLKEDAWKVNVRAEPDVNGRDIGTLQRGESAPYLGESRRDARGVIWYRIRWMGGDGWISSIYTLLE